MARTTHGNEPRSHGAKLTSEAASTSRIIRPENQLEETSMNSTIRFHVTETDLGPVPVTLSDKGLHSIELPFATREDAMRSVAESGATDPVSPAEAEKIDAMIDALVTGHPVNGALPIDWTGITPFRRQVLEECGRIPAGQTKSYGWLAAKVGHPNAARAVGRVMATNPGRCSSPATA
jgi:methylated-DNA-[protein]-cysteine S-methyltransferase